MTPLIQTLLIVTILFAMVVIMLGIGRMSSHRYDADRREEDALREELAALREVVSDNSAFNQLLSKRNNRPGSPLE